MSADIIIADDTPENLTLLRDLLTQEGYRVRPVLQGELALRIARKEPPDLILLDVLMPGLNGYETCERLKADPLTADCPVLFISALDGTSDKVRGFQVGGLDYITKPFRQEEVLARVRTHLALRAAQKMLKAQNTALVAAANLQADVERILRHDLRGPLANIIAFSELIAQESGQETPVGENAKIINDAAYSALSMIHGSFDLLRMERGTYELRPETYAIRETLQQIFREMGAIARQKSLSLRLVDAGADDKAGFLVQGERLLTRSLFYNLLKNAIEASPEAGEVSVSLACRAAERMVEVRLHNFGEVPESLRAQFFEKYATAGKIGGSGLGTYSARLMALTQGGSISLDSSVPGQTTLVVILPAAPENALPACQTSLVVAEELAAQRLLIADDDPANRRYLASILPARQIFEAGNGNEALNILAEQTIDLALIDLEMPGMSGLDVVQAYLASIGGRESRVPRSCLIALTGHRDEATFARCRESGFDRVLSKPPGKENLLANLHAALQDLAPVVELKRDMARLMPEFLQSRQGELARLAAAIREEDNAAVISQAHRMQGSFAMYGLQEASRHARAIEQCGVAAGDEARRHLKMLEHYLAQLKIRYS